MRKNNYIFQTFWGQTKFVPPPPEKQIEVSQTSNYYGKMHRGWCHRNGAIEAYLQILPKKVAQPKIHGRVLRSTNTVKSPCLPSHWLTLPSWGPHYLQGHTRSAAPVSSTCSWNCYRQAQGWQSSLDAIARRLALHTCRSDFCINVQIKRDFHSQKAFALIPFEGKLKTKNTEGNMFTKT